MQGKRATRAALVIAVATVLTTIGIASPAQAAKWRVWGVYEEYETCFAAGEALKDSKYTSKFKCDWDSPYFALYIWK